MMSGDLFTSNTVTLYQNKGYPPNKKWRSESKLEHTHVPLSGPMDFYSVHIKILSVLPFFLQQISIIQWGFLAIFILKEQNVSYMQAF